MAHVKLGYESGHLLHFTNRTNSAGEMLSLPWEFLSIQLYVARPSDNRRIDWSLVSEHRCFNAIVDTGTTYTILSHDTWKPFENEIDWLIPAEPQPDLGIAGYSGNRYRLGRIRLAAFDVVRPTRPRQLPPETHLVFFNPPEAPDVNLLGLSSPFFNQRKLTHHGGESWWLTSSILDIPL